MLLMVFLNVNHPDIVLEQYATKEQCQIERNRVGFEMAAAYPNEHTFDIVCRFKPKVI